MTVIVKIPSPLAKRLTVASVQSRRSPDSIARTALAEHLSYLEWRAKAVDEGFASGSRDGWLSSDTVLKNFAKRQATFVKKKRPKAA
jgi:predicted transcriptional regulator